MATPSLDKVLIYAIGRGVIPPTKSRYTSVGLNDAVSKIMFNPQPKAIMVAQHIVVNHLQYSPTQLLMQQKYAWLVFAE